jgi:hypothetical protein
MDPFPLNEEITGPSRTTSPQLRDCHSSATSLIVPISTLEIHLYQCPSGLDTPAQEKVQGCQSPLISPMEPPGLSSSFSLLCQFNKSAKSSSYGHREGTSRFSFPLPRINRHLHLRDQGSQRALAVTANLLRCHTISHFPLDPQSSTAPAPPPLSLPHYGLQDMFQILEITPTI